MYGKEWIDYTQPEPTPYEVDVNKVLRFIDRMDYSDVLRVINTAMFRKARLDQQNNGKHF